MVHNKNLSCKANEFYIFATKYIAKRSPFLSIEPWFTDAAV
jgi:hypothetical protein